MMNQANIALVISGVLYISSCFLSMYYPGIFFAELFSAVCEAALVGGIADWFAVTALFRKPLGFPYHTELISHNRQKLIAATARMVQNELLSTASIQHKIGQVCLVDIFIHWIEKQGGKVLIANTLARYTIRAAQPLDFHELAEMAQSMMKTALYSWEFVPRLRSIGLTILDHNQEEKVLQFLLGKMKMQVAQIDTYNVIYSYLQSYVEKKTASQRSTNFGFLTELLYEGAKALDAINLEDAAKVLQQEIFETIQDLEEQNHPLRLWLKQNLRDVIEKLGQNSTQSAELESWKNALIDRIDFIQILEPFFSYLLQPDLTEREGTLTFMQRHSLLEQVKHFVKKSPMMGWVFMQSERYWGLFLQDKGKQAWLERYFQDAVCHGVESQHEFIGSIVKSVLEQLSNEALNRLIEDKVGEDLQWVRINGSIVGGLVGLCLFLFLHFIYEPWLLPCMKPFIG